MQSSKRNDFFRCSMCQMSALAFEPPHPCRCFCLNHDDVPRNRPISKYSGNMKWFFHWKLYRIPQLDRFWDMLRHILIHYIPVVQFCLWHVNPLNKKSRPKAIIVFIIFDFDSFVCRFWGDSPTNQGPKVYANLSVVHTVVKVSRI